MLDEPVAPSRRRLAKLAAAGGTVSLPTLMPDPPDEDDELEPQAASASASATTAAGETTAAR